MFEVGKKVIAIKDDKYYHKAYKKYEVFKLLAIRENICACHGSYMLDIGKTCEYPSDALICGTCGKKVPDNTQTVWCDSEDFAPLR